MKKNQQPRIAVVSGTNREGAYTLKIAQIILRLLKLNGVNGQLLDLAQLPIEVYLSTSYYNKPNGFDFWQGTLDQSNGVIFCTPEYNSAYPGILKHFIDVLRYPDSLRNKPVALVGLTSSANVKKSGALASMTELMNFLQADLFKDQVFIQQCKRVISEDGVIRDLSIYSSLNTQLEGFVKACR